MTVPEVPMTRARASMKQAVFPLARTTSTPLFTRSRMQAMAVRLIRRSRSVMVPSTSQATALRVGTLRYWIRTGKKRRCSGPGIPQPGPGPSGGFPGLRRASGRTQTGQAGLRPYSRRPSGRLEARLLHHEDRLALGQVRAVHELRDPLPALALPEVDPEGRGVADDVPANGFRRVAEEDRRVGEDLVRNEADGIVLVQELEEVVHVPVQLLLPGREGPPPGVLGPEVGGEGVDDEEPHRPLAVPEIVRELPGVLDHEHLVVGGVGPGDMDMVKELLDRGDVDAEAVHRLLDPLGAEGVLGVDEDAGAVEAPRLLGKLDVHRHLVDDLALP